MQLRMKNTNRKTGHWNKTHKKWNCKKQMYICMYIGILIYRINVMKRKKPRKTQQRATDMRKAQAQY